jgi:hypothetical protein
VRSGNERVRMESIVIILGASWMHWVGCNDDGDDAAAVFQVKPDPFIEQTADRRSDRATSRLSTRLARDPCQTLSFCTSPSKRTSSLRVPKRVLPV